MGKEKNNRFTLLHGDALTKLQGIPSSSIDSIVTDPPYGLSKQPDMHEVLKHWLNGDDYEHQGKGFMGKSWDSFVPGPSIWKECLRVLKPGGHLLAFAGTRTQDLMALAIRLGGFEIRDSIDYLYDPSSDEQAFFDSLNAQQKEALARLSDQGDARMGWLFGSGFPKNHDIAKAMDKAATEEAQRWEGWGTALKPAHEPIIVARKPFSGNVAANVASYGTGAINIDGSRIELNGDYKCKANGRPSQTGLSDYYNPEKANCPDTVGRFPANIIHDGSPEVLACFPESKGQAGAVTGNEPSAKTNAVYGSFQGRPPTKPRSDVGSAARFFYCAKTSPKDRNEGLNGDKNTHPTVKPASLMAYLVKLVTPPGGTCLDPFCGSGSTGKGALKGNFYFIGIDREREYLGISEKRLRYIQRQQEENAAA